MRREEEQTEALAQSAHIVLQVVETPISESLSIDCFKIQGPWITTTSHGSCRTGERTKGGPKVEVSSSYFRVALRNFFSVYD